MNKEYVEIGISSFIALLFFTTFICLFFFVSGKSIDNSVVTDNVLFLVDDLANDQNVLSYKEKKILGEALSNVKLSDMTNEDKLINEHNKGLTGKILITLSILIAVILGSSYGLCYYYDLNFNTILLKNLYLLIGVAIIEILFILIIVKNYILADPNEIRYNIINQLRM